jgi:hypothetical protein
MANTGYSPMYGNPSQQMGGLGLNPSISPLKPAFGNNMEQGSMQLTQRVTDELQNYNKQKPRFNPYEVGASALGQIGGGQRAIIGNDVWETGGQLSGTMMGNVSSQIGDVAGQFGPVGKMVGLGLKGASDLINLASVDPEVSDIDIGDQLMQEGGPTLQIGENIGAAGQIKDNAGKTVGQGALAGGKTGAAIGSIFGPLGTGIGGVLGAGAGAFLGGEAKRKLEKAYREAMGEIDETTGEFNTANIVSSNQRFGEARRLDMLGRERNPFLVNSNSPFIV